MTACAASCVTLTRGATLSTPGFARRFSIPARAPRVVRVSAESEGSEIFTDEDPVDEKVIIEPRMTFGLDVHRRIHHEACRQMAYQAQWRAFCERSKLDWKDCVSGEDETTLCSFHYELEKGLERFERAKENDDLGGWPPRTLHPTQGLPAIQASFRAAVQSECEGRETLFQHYEGPGRRKFQLGRRSTVNAENAGDTEV